ncbi:baseplate protein J [Spirulina sp. CS-785/01]|uniref:baseplate protein J n=1 Tax=Spirulina sp. CS-785/01 TaxID=3021716 RepID=UPI00232B1E08|nr:baseplate protein J [Spirulina sp. CS-785/01]MDB9315304.1 baseplate protein J [Spirulina sp. CS-785/01]
MPIPLPNLDDRTYADLVEDAIAQIPIEAPEWTDHNPSDTGIILIELLAWLTEMVLYRVNQIPELNQAQFLSLLKGQPWVWPTDIPTAAQAALVQREIQKTLAELRRPYRAVTNPDFAQLILTDWGQTRYAQREFGEAGAIARVNCLPKRDLENADIHQPVEAHLSLVILPRYPQSDASEKQRLHHDLKRFLDQRRLITTRLHVIEPEFVDVTLSAVLYLQDSANPPAVQAQAERQITAFFAPLNSQEFWQGQGYPFGADIYLSELYQLLDDLPGVDHVEDLQLSGFDPSRQHFNAQNQLIGVAIQDHELVNIQIASLSTLQRFGDQWQTNP